MIFVVFMFRLFLAIFRPNKKPDFLIGPEDG